MKAIIIILLLQGCASKLLKQAPPLAAHETFYVFEEEVYQISHNRCKKLEGKDRKCTKTYFNVGEMWNVFYPGHIIIFKAKVFK